MRNLKETLNHGLILKKIRGVIKFSNLVKKADYNKKVSEIEKKTTDHDHDKYITTPEFNKLTAENFAARLSQANLVTKTDFYDKLKNRDKKTNSNETKHVLVENELKKLKTFDSICFCCKSHFEDDSTQNYLAFQTTCRCFKRVSHANDHILSWKYKGFSDENIKPPSTSNNNPYPLLNYVGTKTRVELN